MQDESTLRKDAGEPTGALLADQHGANGDAVILGVETDVETITTRPYPFDASPTVVIVDGDISYTHKMQRALFEHEERRERMTEVVRRTLGRATVVDDEGKADKAQRSKAEGDDVRASLRYYDDLVGTVGGYEFDGQVVEDVDPRTITVEAMRDDGKGNMRLVSVPVLEEIPASDKLYVVSKMYAADYELDKSQRVKLGSGRVWRVIQTIGAQMRADGTKSDPLFRIVYELAEPTDHLLRLSRRASLNTVDVDLKGGESESHRTVNMETMCTLFDGVAGKGRGVVGITGGTVGGLPIDVNNSTHLALVPPVFKKSVVLMLYGRLTRDMGN